MSKNRYLDWVQIDCDKWDMFFSLKRKRSSNLLQPIGYFDADSYDILPEQVSIKPESVFEKIRVYL